MSNTIKCCLMRGGTSKGVVFLQEDLPRDTKEQDQLILTIIGAPDPYQL